MYSLGLDIGCSSFKLSLLSDEKKWVSHIYRLHQGRVGNELPKALIELTRKFGRDRIAWGSVTGSGSKLLSGVEGLQDINEVRAAVEGTMSLDKEVGSIIEIGGQSAKYITEFSPGDQSRIKISINSSCSAGTGSYLEEQLSRLNLSFEDYAIYAARARSIPRIAGRCSVFAKTDITHHQQQGVPVEDILMGLAHAVVKNYRASVMKRLPRNKPILFAGGVSKNQTIVTVLRENLKLMEDELIVDEHSANLVAMGAAVAGLQNRFPLDLDSIVAHLEQCEVVKPMVGVRSELPRLASFGVVDNQDKHRTESPALLSQGAPCYLGVDVGSTSTNLVLTDAGGRIAAYRYLRTLGRPAIQVLQGLDELRTEIGPQINIAGVGVTGSGRYLIAELLGADAVKDEITAQAKAAVTLDDEIDTIFEIGGQDSKFISLTDGVVTDFQMNKVCAAGTGSFIEEQANKFNIPVQDLGEIALFGNHPTNLGERCTVFIETSIAAHLAQGARIEDIAAGLCYSIVKNYLNRVVGTKRIGRKISFQGGVAHNAGVVNAFKSLTGRDVFIPPFFSVTGAMGAAILAREEVGHAPGKFKGFDLEAPRHAPGKPVSVSIKRSNTDRFNQRVNEMVFEGYVERREAGLKTVGIPRALFTFGMFPMFNAFFRELGVNVLLSEPTSEKTIELGQEYSLDETCYPIKLINGHVAELVEKKVDYIFFPDLYTVEHPGSHTRQDYGCVYMQLAFKIVNQAMELQKHGIELLAPTIAFNQGPEFMKKSFSDLGRRLGKSPEETNNALQIGMQAFHRFEERMEKQGREALAAIGPDEKAFVLISKIYGVADPVLNMGIPGKLMDMGYKVLNFYELPETDIAPLHPNMYWPFGQHILEAARLVKNHPNLHAILLTHHSCGPDSVFIHYFREIMAGKPYLNIEVDEHSSDVGLITRVEAFVNSLSRIATVPASEINEYANAVECPPTNLISGLSDLRHDATLCLPNLFPYSRLLADMLRQRGVKVKTLPLTTGKTVDLGRKHTLTSEYLSFTAFMGDVLAYLDQNGSKPERYAFFVPQSEGAEVDGQYSRLLRTVLDEEGYRNVDIVTPYMEDALFQSPEQARAVWMTLLAGDLINLAPLDRRTEELNEILKSSAREGLRLGTLQAMAERIHMDLWPRGQGKRILVLGEPAVLFNDYLNGFYLRAIQEQGHTLVMNPLSEMMWFFWTDFIQQNPQRSDPNIRRNLQALAEGIQVVSLGLGDHSPFEKDPEKLVRKADETLGFYSGANGRYRFAKQLRNPDGINGVITMSSTYENTGIALGILQRALSNGRPTLNLTFDGSPDRNSQAKIESFIHYL